LLLNFINIEGEDNMKTFSKVLSMFLVVVMCFGLFATSAYADSFSLDGSDDNAATEQNSMTTGGFSLDTPVVPESVVSEMQQATQYADGNANANSFALENANDAPAAKQEAQDEFTIDGFSLGDTDTFDASRYIKENEPGRKKGRYTPKG
jgi:hypothetical protein